MSINRNPPKHPGHYVKDNILPKDMTVKKAAEMMGIGRPAFSNFLNGKASLSQNMATRLSKAFGADKTELLNMQQEYSDSLDKENEDQIAVRSYAPSFLNIRASRIDTWAEQIETRSLLAALLRRLVNSTGSVISHSDFPAYDNSQKPGWDGYTISNNATPWVPIGNSGWEFGCNKNPNTKADNDYLNRTKNTPKKDRKNITFIFVTPRNWNKKDGWIKSKKEQNEWKDVRAYDANDLEQWLELSVSGQVWLAEKIGIPNEGCKTLDDYWKFWSETATPNISRKIFDSAISAYSKKLIEWYQKPAERPLVITAGSKEEALAFIACASYSLKELHPFSEQAVLVSNADTTKRLATISTEFIPIAHTDNVEIELVTSFKNRHTIVVAEKNLKGMEADIIVDLPNYKSFCDALTEMEFDDAQREIHSNQSGRSPTILRRQLATSPTFKKPSWATADNISSMISLVLAGTWNSSKSGDKEILKNLSNDEYSSVEKNIAYLADMDDAPIWSEGKCRGIVSKLDCFFTISNQITEDDLTKFFFVAEYVLSEDDPALDLNKSDRWAANIYDKVRDHSNLIRESMCETLIILSIHGDGLFGKRLGFNIESKINLLIRKLLENQSTRVWQSQQDDLPRYAEAAPEQFLDIVESELAKQNPAFEQLFESEEAGMFSRCERTGMLWALELLAWEPTRLSRVIAVLAQLCSYKLEDNLAHKPISLLNDILLSWKPHTAASVEQRCKTLELLCRKYPDIGWEICMRQLKPGNDVTFGTYRPRWRSDASGAGQIVTNKDIIDFRKKCQELVLSWSSHTKASLSDLIDCLAIMENKDKEKVTKQICAWLDSSPSDDDILDLREHVRTSTMTSRVRHRDNRETTYANGKNIYNLLEPKNIILKYQWLFANHWVDYSPEELGTDDIDFSERNIALSKQRIAALKAVLELHGTDGVIELCLKGDAGFVIGLYLAKDIMSKEELHVFIFKCLSIQSKKHIHRINRCISGILNQFKNKTNKDFLGDLIARVETNDQRDVQRYRLLLNAPFSKPTWTLLQKQNEKIQKKYWQNIYPSWNDQSAEELNFVVNQLVNAERPRAAFDLAHSKLIYIESDRLINLLTEVGTKASEPEGDFPIQSYEIEQALKSLNKRDNVAHMDLVELEYLYVEFLTSFSQYGIPNLSKEISESPLLFMQLLALCSHRNDNKKDPSEWKLPAKSEQNQSIVNKAYSALENASVIPGTLNNGKIDIEQLRNWINKVRSLAKENSRQDIADQRIGQILSKSSIGDDGVWPREEIREIFEEVASKEISIGMEIGIRNAQGAGFRPRGGAPEHELEKKYRNFANKVMHETPFVGLMLMSIADSYKHDAEWHDTDDRVQRRLHN